MRFGQKLPWVAETLSSFEASSTWRDMMSGCEERTTSSFWSPEAPLVAVRVSHTAVKSVCVKFTLYEELVVHSWRKHTWGWRCCNHSWHDERWSYWVQEARWWRSVDFVHKQQSTSRFGLLSGLSSMSTTLTAGVIDSPRFFGNDAAAIVRVLRSYVTQVLCRHNHVCAPKSDRRWNWDEYILTKIIYIWIINIRPNWLFKKS